MTRRKLPIGIQTFSKIRTEEYYYVDKTALMEKLITEGSYYFLSRPRRFGKSLLLDTFKELFEGNQALFGGLFIHDRWDWSKQHPVIRISFGLGVVHDPDDLRVRMREILAVNAERLGITLPEATHSECFRYLVNHAHIRTGHQAVVLIDEYDKPILDNITNKPVATEMRELLKDFYAVLKDCDTDLRFVFLTGVSKFSKVSLFSGLNNLEDITITPRYSALCGYRDEDLDVVFAAELEGLDRDEIRRWYNGYNWLGEPVYNPFDLLLLFRNRQFRAWWFETGTPTFLIKLLEERRPSLPELAHREAEYDLIASFDVDDIPTEALMFQAGYLTIDSVEDVSGVQYYQLRYPNKEVLQSLHGYLLRSWTGHIRETGQHKKNLFRLLTSTQLQGLRDLFEAFFASIPYTWYTNNPIAQYEGYYASVVYAYFAGLGLDIVVEDITHHGRIDMTVRFPQQIYIFEFKVVELEGRGSALAQIKARNYAEKYKAHSTPIHQIGIEFSKESRQVVGFEVETL